MNADLLDKLEKLDAAYSEGKDKAWNDLVSALYGWLPDLLALARDGLRYRWLRKNSYVDWAPCYQKVQVEFPLDAEGFQNLDGAIDAAMRGEK